MEKEDVNGDPGDRAGIAAAEGRAPHRTSRASRALLSRVRRRLFPYLLVLPFVLLFVAFFIAPLLYRLRPEPL